MHVHRARLACGGEEGACGAHVEVREGVSGVLWVGPGVLLEELLLCGAVGAGGLPEELGDALGGPQVDLRGRC